MSSIEEIKAKLQELNDVVSAFQVAAPVVTAEEVVKLEGEVAALDTELRSDETPVA